MTLNINNLFNLDQDQDKPEHNIIHHSFGLIGWLGQDPVVNGIKNKLIICLSSMLSGVQIGAKFQLLLIMYTIRRIVRLDRYSGLWVGAQWIPTALVVRDRMTVSFLVRQNEEGLKKSKKLT